jgi:hypothetical protein
MRLTEDFSCISFATNLMPLCGEAFFIGLYLLRNLCHSAAKHFSLASFAKNHLPLRGEAFHSIPTRKSDIC